MRKHTQRGVIVAVAMAAMVLGGCSQLSQTQKGAVIGAAGGGAAGAAVGKATGSTARGAIIGAAVGGTAGALIGRRMDKQADELSDEIPGATVQRVGEGIVVTFDSGILFGFDSADLQSAAQENLKNLAASLERHGGTQVLLIGHTDGVGAEAYNQQLSERRAESARQFLLAQGLSADRVEAAGRGLTEPIASNDTEEGQQENRRVEVAIFAGEEMRQDAGR